MKKLFIFVFLLILLIITQHFFYWWTLVIPCFFIGYLICNSSWHSFLIAFLTLFFLWSLYSFFLDFYSNGKMSSQISIMLFMPSKYILFITSGLIGGIVAGLSSLMGYEIKKINAVK